MRRVSLSRSAAQYLALRRALGFKLRHETWFLPDFLSFLARHRSSVITTDLALRWAQQPLDASAGWWAHRLNSVRSFARYHRGFDPRTEVPPRDLIPHRPTRITPHLYTDQEVATLMRRAADLPGRLRAATYASLIGILAVTGMRLGEVLALDDADVDWDRSLLTVRHAKFQKSRLVPLHVTTLDALRHYAARRDQLLPRRQTPSFFVSGVGARVHPQNFQLVFSRLRASTGLDAGPGRCPRIHDLRHSFAMRSLRDWYRSGVDTERRLPVLSTYLGHVDPTTTYWYLTATPELLRLAATRVEHISQVRP
jgi:integrase/recombinase XerD